MVRDTINVIIESRETGESEQLDLVESQYTPLLFEDDNGELSILLSDNEFGDNPEALDTTIADTLSIDVTSTKFGKPFRGYMSVYETDLETRTFKDESIAGTFAVSAANGTGRSAEFTGQRDGISWEGIVFTETESDVFSSADMILRIVPSSNSWFSKPLSPDYPNKMLGVFSDPAQDIENEIIFMMEDDVASLNFVARVPEDTILFTARSSGRPTPRVTPTLEELDLMVKVHKAYKIRITGLQSPPSPPTIRIEGLDPEGNVKEYIEPNLIQDPQDPDVYVTDRPILTYDGDRSADFDARYAQDYYLLGGPEHKVKLLKLEVRKAGLVCLVIGDSLGAGMQSISMYKGLQEKGFTSLFSAPFGWKHQMPVFSYSSGWLGKKGWPASLYVIKNDQPHGKLKPGSARWGYMDLDRKEKGFKPGGRIEKDNRKIDNFAVPGIEIQHLNVTSGRKTQVKTGENPAPEEEKDTWSYRLSHTNRQILRGHGVPLPEGLVSSRRPHVLIVSIGGNDLLESITSGPYGDPDGPLRNDNDGSQPSWPNDETRPNVTWRRDKTDVPLNFRGLPDSDGNGTPDQEEWDPDKRKYDPLDFGEYCTKPDIFEAQLRKMLDSLEAGYARKDSRFKDVTEEKDKPIVLLNKIPDIKKVPLLLTISKDKRVIGWLPFATASTYAVAGYNLTWMEQIKYRIAPSVKHTYGPKARVSFLAVMDRATGPGSYFDKLWPVGSGRATKRDIVRGLHRLPTVDMHDLDILSDEEMEFIENRKKALDEKIEEVRTDNVDNGQWPHLRIIVVDTDATFDSIPPGSDFDLGPTGGIFSLDMVHPNSQGYKLLANQYIKAVNELIAAGKFFGVKSSLQAPLYTLPLPKP